MAELTAGRPDNGRSAEGGGATVGVTRQRRGPVGERGSGEERPPDAPGTELDYRHIADRVDRFSCGWNSAPAGGSPENCTVL